jgi:5'-nucleotidase
VGPSGPRHDDGPGTDFHAVIEGYVSVTPLTIDLTNHHALDDVHQWFGPYE